MSKRKPTKQLAFVVGDRVVFNSGDALDRQEATGEILSVVHHLAIIRPDVPIDGTVAITTRLLRDLQKEAQ